MSEQSTPSDPLRGLREAFAAATAENLDGVTADLAPNAVWEMDEVGHVLSERVGDTIIREDDRVKNSDVVVEARVAHVIESVDGLVTRDTTYTDIDYARTAAERLAQERG